MTEVRLTDRIVLTDGQAASVWLERWRADYLPGACERGLVLLGLQQAHHGPDSVTVTVEWSLPDPYAFYAMRSAAAADAAVAEFWSWTDGVALGRDRRAGAVLEVAA